VDEPQDAKDDDLENRWKDRSVEFILVR